MKITSVECYLGQFITMKINTDEGIYGWGEAGLAYGNSFEAAFGQCQDFAKLIIGMDPFDTEKIWEHLHRHTFWGMGGGVVITSAMAAIDTACWDIKGKALGVPVYKLLGGKTNPKLRAYASQLQFGWSDLIQKDNKGEALGHQGRPRLCSHRSRHPARKDLGQPGHSDSRLLSPARPAALGRAHCSLP